MARAAAAAAASSMASPVQPPAPSAGAARAGTARPAGTDGFDHPYRQRVDPRYEASVRYDAAAAAAMPPISLLSGTARRSYKTLFARSLRLQLTLAVLAVGTDLLTLAGLVAHGGSFMATARQVLHWSTLVSLALTLFAWRHGHAAVRSSRPGSARAHRYASLVAAALHVLAVRSPIHGASEHQRPLFSIVTSLAAVAATVAALLSYRLERQIIRPPQRPSAHKAPASD